MKSQGAKVLNLGLSPRQDSEEDEDDSDRISIVTSISTGTSSSSSNRYLDMIQTSSTRRVNQVINLITGKVVDNTSFGIGLATGLILAFGILPLIRTIILKFIDFIRFSIGWIIVLSIILSVKRSQIGLMVTSGMSKYSPCAKSNSSGKKLLLLPQDSTIKRSKSSSSSRITPIYDKDNDVLVDNVQVVSTSSRHGPSIRQSSSSSSRSNRNVQTRRQPSPLRNVLSSSPQPTLNEYSSTPLLQPHHKKVTLHKGGDQYSFKLGPDTSSSFSMTSPSPALSQASSSSSGVVDYFTSK